MKYILDFDHTLLNTDAFVAQVRTDGNIKNLITPEIWQQYETRHYLYGDVLSWMMDKSKNDLHILTAVTPSLGPQASEFQEKKLVSGKFDDLVSSITYMVGEKGAHAAEIAKQFPPHETVVFVDDRIEHCVSVKESLPTSLACLMVRNSDAVSEQSTIADIPIIQTLYDIDDMIESL